MAGCNVKDWYNKNGTVRLQLDIQDAQTSSLDSFRSVMVAIYGASIKQAGDALNPPQDFTFGSDPLIVDIVQKGKAREVIPLAEFKTNLRATERVLVRIVVFEAIDAAGAPMEVCRVTDTPEKFPCFYQPAGDALLYEEKDFSPPRGGTVIVHFPIAIKYAQQGRVAEYFLHADPALVQLENRR